METIMKRFKYPRTFHLPWSLGATSDDKTHSLEMIESIFSGKEVIVTEKLDGENSTIYPDGYSHARSVNSAHHPSRSQLKSLTAKISYNIPQGFRICGENVFAEHSISYDKLEAFFYVFSIFEGETCLSWADTEEYSELLGIPTVPVLYRGKWNAQKVQESWNGVSTLGDTSEGYVVRLASSFSFQNFGKSAAKYVRANHVQTDTHWMHQTLKPNKLSAEKDRRGSS